MYISQHYRKQLINGDVLNHINVHQNVWCNCLCTIIQRDRLTLSSGFSALVLCSNILKIFERSVYFSLPPANAKWYRCLAIRQQFYNLFLSFFFARARAALGFDFNLYGKILYMGSRGVKMLIIVKYCPNHRKKKKQYTTQSIIKHE